MRFDINDSQPVYLRLLLLILAEAVAGVCLYALFGFVPIVLKAGIVVVAWVVVELDNFSPKKPKSLALLSVVTGVLVVACSLVMHFPRYRYDDILFRLLMVGFCLTALLIWLDRRGIGTRTITVRLGHENA